LFQNICSEEKYIAKNVEDEIKLKLQIGFDCKTPQVSSLIEIAN
jgi:hypothetical protein